MATALDIITKAMKLLGVLAAGTAPSSEEATDGLDSLNDMLAQWEAQNIYTGIGTLALTDTVPVDAKHVEAVKALLAVKIAPLFGIAVPIDVKKMSMTGWQLLKGDFFDTEELRGDDGLSFMPSQRRYW